MSKPESICCGDGSCGQDPFVCPLSRVVAGTAVKIKHLGTPPEVTHRLREMGLGEEQQIKLLCRQSNFICLVCNARLGISSKVADAILVEPIHGKQSAA